MGSTGGGSAGGRAAGAPRRAGQSRAGRKRQAKAAQGKGYSGRTAFAAVSVEVERGVASGRLLRLDGLESSHVDLADPRRLVFSYIRRIGDVVDLAFGAGEPLDALHLGGGGFTLPRYVAATRPGSRSEVYERDQELYDVAREHLGLRTSKALRVRIGDARHWLGRRPADSADLVICDVFDGPVVPPSFTTAEYLAEVRHVLRPGGVHVWNLIDLPPLDFARAEAATALAAFAHAALAAPPALLRGREAGNMVLAASDRELPVAALRARASDAPVREDVLDTEQLQTFRALAPVLTDAEVRPTRLARLHALWSGGGEEA